MSFPQQQKKTKSAAWFSVVAFFRPTEKRIFSTATTQIHMDRVKRARVQEAPKEHLKFINTKKKGYKYDDGVFYCHLKRVSDEDEKKALKFLEQKGDIGVVYITSNTEESWDVTLGLTKDGKVVNVLRSDDPDIEMKKKFDIDDDEVSRFPEVHCGNHLVLDDNTKVFVVQEGSTFWGDADMDEFKNVMLIWLLCLMEGIPLVDVKH